MEIEKKRETSWKIRLKQNNNHIEITSVEISGEVRQIKLALLDNDKVIKVQMNKEEFFNFLSLLYAFKDVIIGEDFIESEDSLIFKQDTPIEPKEQILEKEIYQIEHSTKEEEFEDNNSDELNPEEWDPW